jgi:hypothetical protein
MTDTTETPQSEPITGGDAIKFASWCNGLDFANDANIEDQDVLDAFRGFSVADLIWLCRAINQAQGIPDLAIMAKAILARDVAILRSGDRNP